MSVWQKVWPSKGSAFGYYKPEVNASGVVLVSKVGATSTLPPCPIKICGSVSDCGPYDICGCGTEITESGTYTLQKNLKCNDTAIIVSANNVVIDLAGYTLRGPGRYSPNSFYYKGHGVHVDKSDNVVVKNGEITRFKFGVSMWGAFMINRRT